MQRSPQQFMFVRMLVLGIALLSLSHIAAAQFEPAPTPIADPRDTRFVGVKEDWTSPSLEKSNLKPVQPLVGYIEDQASYTVELLQVQWRWGDPIDLYVLKPKGIKKPPVILYLYSYPMDTDRFKNETWEKEVTKDGFAAVGFVSALTGHRYHDRPAKEWFISELQECLATSTHDIQMVLDYLSARGDLDLTRVGMFAQGSGASIAILASAVDPRIKVLDTIDPWGDWPVWMASSPFVPEEERANYVKPEFLKKVAPLEPIDWLPKMQAKAFRLQDAIFETNTPKEAKEKLRAAVPKGGALVVYKTPEDFKAVIRANKELDWLHDELRALPEAEDGNQAALQKK
ncbi:MAG: alpha/beta hydrolase family protein [Terriglobales bacterium]